MYDPSKLLEKLERLKQAAEAHNTNPIYQRLGYGQIAPYCATIRYPDKPPYVALFNSTTGEGDARKRFYEIDAHARLAALGKLTIELAALR